MCLSPCEGRSLVATVFATIVTNTQSVASACTDPCLIVASDFWVGGKGITGDAGLHAYLSSLPVSAGLFGALVGGVKTKPCITKRSEFAYVLLVAPQWIPCVV